MKRWTETAFWVGAGLILLLAMAINFWKWPPEYVACGYLAIIFLVILLSAVTGVEHAVGGAPRELQPKAAMKKRLGVFVPFIFVPLGLWFAYTVVSDLRGGLTTQTFTIAENHGGISGYWIVQKVKIVGRDEKMKCYLRLELLKEGKEYEITYGKVSRTIYSANRIR